MPRKKIDPVAVPEGDNVVDQVDLIESDEQTPPFELPTLPVSPETTAHALEAAPVNSKIVVVRLEGSPSPFAVLATPDGATRLPDGDPAHGLPEGARIRKTKDDEYIAEQMSPVEQRRQLVTATASDAIACFLPWFHGEVTPDSQWRGVPESVDG